MESIKNLFIVRNKIIVKSEPALLDSDGKFIKYHLNPSENNLESLIIILPINLYNRKRAGTFNANKWNSINDPIFK
jgi:hypothetical protein